jgi:hypothetical protein
MVPSFDGKSHQVSTWTKQTNKTEFSVSAKGEGNTEGVLTIDLDADSAPDVPTLGKRSPAVPNTPSQSPLPQRKREVKSSQKSQLAPPKSSTQKGFNYDDQQKAQQNKFDEIYKAQNVVNNSNSLSKQLTTRSYI